MRHQIAGYRLGRTKSARIALRRNLIKQFFTHERIQTTKAKAAAIRGDAERLITLAENSESGTTEQTVNARRLAVSRLGHNQNIKRLFDEIAPRFATRNGGYTRILKLKSADLKSALFYCYPPFNFIHSFFMFNEFLVDGSESKTILHSHHTLGKILDTGDRVI